VHRLGDDMVNFYLVEDGPELLLVDAGLPRHFPQLTRLLERLGRALPDINAVLLTRGHVDHLGIAERVRRESGRRSGCTRQMRQLSNARHVQRRGPNRKAALSVICCAAPWRSAWRGTSCAVAH
jgi:glyoxylase-like metal-dependent hydrolase (beta-lactamase superfamily II)